MATTTLRDAVLDVTLGGTSDAGLIEAVIRLTHRVHAATEQSSSPAADKLRAQRDIVCAEIQRRMGDAR